jgi:redox-sensing transcriptional repressor
VELGDATGCAAEQVRKDISFLAGQGKSRVGYKTKKLAEIIEDYLGMEIEKRAILVGVGNLGRAIALYPGFSQYGLSIVGIFDNDPNLFGQPVGNLIIQPTVELPEFICKNNIKVGIITTPLKPPRRWQMK